jgi:hypothetical protein
MCCSIDRSKESLNALASQSGFCATSIDSVGLDHQGPIVSRARHRPRRRSTEFLFRGGLRSATPRHHSHRACCFEFHNRGKESSCPVSREKVERSAKERCRATVIVSGYRGAERGKRAAVLERERGGDRRIVRNGFDRTARSPRGNEQLGDRVNVNLRPACSKSKDSRRRRWGSFSRSLIWRLP